MEKIKLEFTIKLGLKVYKSHVLGLNFTSFSLLMKL